MVCTKSCQGNLIFVRVRPIRFQKLKSYFTIFLQTVQHTNICTQRKILISLKSETFVCNILQYGKRENNLLMRCDIFNAIICATLDLYLQ
jgi:hypothetical protein